MDKSTRIDLTEYEDKFPEVNDRIRVNHNNCPAGLDTKSRLEIKRKDNGDVIAYCHHCSGWGIKRDGVVRSIYKRPVSPANVMTSEPYTLPSDAVFDPLMWPREARRWPKMYGITDKELVDNNICFSPRLERVVIPCYSETKVLTGYQTRKVFDTDKKPKYLTYAKKGSKYFLPSKVEGPLPYIVLVEDALSAIKLGRLVKYPVAVLGSDLPSVEMCGILSSFPDATHVFLAFDNDNPHVKENQLKVFRRIQILSPSTDNCILYLDDDPKTYSLEELHEHFKGYK